MVKWGAHWIRTVIATLQFRIFHFLTPLSHPQIQILFSPVTYGCEISCQSEERANWGCSRTKCRVEYLDLRERERKYSRIKKNVTERLQFIIFALVLLGRFKDGWAGHATLVRKWKVLTKTWSKTWGKVQFWRPTSSWQDNVKMNVREVACNDVDCIPVA